MIPASSFNHILERLAEVQARLDVNPLDVKARYQYKDLISDLERYDVLLKMDVYAS